MTTATCIDGDEHLDRLKFDDVRIWENCLILFGMIVGFNALALAIIYYRQPKYLALSRLTTAIFERRKRIWPKKAIMGVPVTDSRGSEGRPSRGRVVKGGMYDVKYSARDS